MGCGGDSRRRRRSSIPSAVDVSGEHDAVRTRIARDAERDAAFGAGGNACCADASPDIYRAIATVGDDASGACAGRSCAQASRIDQAISVTEERSAGCVAVQWD